MSKTQEKEFYTTAEVARILGVHTRTVIRMIDRGELGGSRVTMGRGSHRRVTPAQLRAYQMAKRVAGK